MEVLTQLQASQKANHSHVTGIFNKIEDTPMYELDEMTVMYFRTTVTQL